MLMTVKMSDMIRALKRSLDGLFFGINRMLLRPSRAGSRTIVLIRTDGIGDLVFFLPVARLLRKAFPHHAIALICRRESAPIAPSQLFDAVVPFQYRSYRWNYIYRLMILARIRQLRPSLGIYCSYHRQHIGDEMTLLSGAARTMAFEGNDEIIHPAVRRNNNSLYTEVIQVPDHSPEIAKYKVLLERLRVKGMRMRENDNPLLSLGEKTEARKNYVVIAGGGSAAIRRWPHERFAELGDAVAKRWKMPVVLCGGPEEKSLLTALAGRMKTPPRIVTDMPLTDAVALIKGARLFIGNESGLLHIAASVGTPAVGILGGGHFSRYFPYGSGVVVNHPLDCYECNWQCPFSEPYCLTRISVQDVMKKVEMKMGKQ